MKYDLLIYTDGSCSGNPGKGGWGCVLENTRTKERECFFGGEKTTTNNRMEITAVLMSIKKIKDKKIKKIAIYTDSKYVQQGITLWIQNWKKNNWKTYNKKPVKNQDLWQQLDSSISTLDIDWIWIKGHGTDEGNNLADELARKGTESVE
ncbi:ribonuclease HI [Anaplasmataceae bacterium AB001_6]|nr:ribonuclease HI [Anaplasmataceae bacterium AB001_6]